MVFRLDSFNPGKNAFATRQLVLLATSIAFYDFWLARAQKSKLKFSISDIFLRFSFYSFSFLFTAVIDFLLGLLVVKKLPRKSHGDGQSMEQLGVVAESFALSFSLNFLSIFVHISGSIRPIALIWTLSRPVTGGTGFFQWVK